MNTLMLCGSPHDKGGNSTYILEGLREKLGVEKTIYNIMKTTQICETLFLNAVKNGDNIVFSFPLYVDSLPAYLLDFLRRMEKEMAGIITCSRVYVIVNCGFYDAKQTHIALSIMWKWCEKCGLQKGSAVAIGGGGLTQIAPIGKGPMASVGDALENLAEHIKQGQKGETLYIEPSFPRFMYKFFGNRGFTVEGKKNGLSKADIRRKI